jgi:hypothetical protein
VDFALTDGSEYQLSGSERIQTESLTNRKEKCENRANALRRENRANASRHRFDFGYQRGTSLQVSGSRAPAAKETVATVNYYYSTLITMLSKKKKLITNPITLERLGPK